MTVTAKLLKLFRVDQQLRGLRTRLDAAERFLKVQSGQLAELEAKSESLSTQVRSAKAAIGTDESETAAIDARMATLREQMNSARTNKEYSAFLTELNTLKGQKDAIEKRELEQMERLQGLEKQLAELTAQREERVKVVEKARTDRGERESEIKGRLEELAQERTVCAGDVPSDALKVFEDLVRARGDEAMAPVEVLDRRAHEYTCGACQMTLPVETLNHIVKGTLVRCANCQCILFSAEVLDLHKKTAPRGKKAKEAQQEV
ncbi:MAG: zinc ribbon domain-containing protein [Phycisphaerales bacterium]